MSPFARRAPALDRLGATTRITEKRRTMDEQFMGNLTNAVKTVTVSRKRALQLIGGAMAVAAASRVPQAAEAGKHRQPPLAFVSVAVSVDGTSGGTRFDYGVTGLAAHPTAGKFGLIGETINLASNLPPDKGRAAIVAQLKSS